MAMAFLFNFWNFSSRFHEEVAELIRCVAPHCTMCLFLSEGFSGNIDLYSIFSQDTQRQQKRTPLHHHINAVSFSHLIYPLAPF
jgi:hypothetical protein